MALTQDDLTKWWITGTGSVVNRFSEVMDDAADGPAVYHLDADNAWTDDSDPEWYVACATKPDNVSENLAGWRNMTDAGDDQNGSLASDEWSYDTGNNRVYVQLSDDSDPNATDVRLDYDWDGAGAGPAFATEVVEDEIYRIHNHLEIGDGSTSTTLTSEREYVSFDLGFKCEVQANATLTIGDVSGGYGFNGSMWKISGPDSGESNFCDGGIVNIYSSLIYNGAKCRQHFRTGTATIINSILQAGYRDDSSWYRRFEFDGTMTAVHFTKVFFTDVGTLLLSKVLATSIDVHVHHGRSGIECTALGLEVSGVLITDYTHYDINVWTSGSNRSVEAIDPKVGLANVDIVPAGAGSWIKETYTCNIHVADAGGNDLASALIDCEYAHLVEGSDSKTYKCIADHTAVDADHEPITGTDWADYWILYDAGGGLGGDWDTGFDYKSGTAEFSQQTADANGDMTEQKIQFKRWVGGNQVLEVRLHKFTLSKVGYETLPKEAIYVGAPIRWHLELQPGAGSGNLYKNIGIGVNV